MEMSMPRIPGNPDRDFSVDPADERDAEDLRGLLQRSEIADMFDAMVCRRIGEAISQAKLKSVKSH
jgi:hypothetical protein